MARREIKRYERSGVRTEVTSLRDAPLDELAQLHTNLMRKYGHEHEVASSLASLEEQRREVGDLGCVFLARDGTRALGFSLCFQHAGTLYVKTVGFDYVSSVPLYGNLVFYEPLRVAMREGLRALHFGLSSNQGKLVRGSDALPLYAVLEPFEALDRTRREALERYGERRLERFWMDFGPYVVHQKFADLLPASRR
jgi:predicted N-acyltransferase